MLRARSALLVLLTSGCLVDVTGDVRQSGGAPSGGSSAGGETVVNGGASAGGAAAGGAAAGGAAAGGAAAGAGGAGGAAAGAGGAGGGPVAQHCDPGEFVTNITDGVISCTPVADLAMKALAASCSVYFGWQDNCASNCYPTRFGKVSGSTCTIGGSNPGGSMCQSYTLGADVNVELFSVDINASNVGNDRLFAALYCLPGSPLASECGQDTLVTGYNGTTTTCAPISGAVLDYVRPGCGIVTGWRDICNGCNTPPANYAWSTSTACNPGGGNNSCSQVSAFGDTVQLQSIGLSGLINDDDKFYVGLRCDAATSTEAVVEASACPAGEFVVGVEADGALNCLGLEEAAMTAFRERCSLYYGWNGDCDTCEDPPTKWGRTRDGNCITSGATDDTCSTMMLGNQEVNLYGLNTDDTVDAQDMFRMAFRCE